ncbi:MAG: site-specific DNA-methyltransferase [Chlorobiaceae bacterium]|nr:site-specific DNA-methyltransferase [Chlorobiaceae bacterium]
MELWYHGKISEEELLHSIIKVNLVEIKSYGRQTFHNPANLLVHGDNLIVLRGLLADPSISGKIRQIYIDPPFSTQQEFRSGNGRTSTISASADDYLAYEDRLKGPEYLEYLRQRLIILRELLSDDGSIYLHIDMKVGHYVKIIMDEVFGPSNFRNDITRIKCNPKNFSRKGYGNIKDMILFYSKSKYFVWNEPRQEMTEEDVLRLFPKIDKNDRRYTTNPLHAPGETKNGSTGQVWNGLFPPPGRHWRIPPKELSKLDKLGLIEWSKNGNPRKKIFAEEILSKGKKMQDVLEFKDPPYPNYPTEKNLELIKHLLSASSNVGDIVLDCFCGSGTTLIAAEELNRRWIGIDSSKVAIDKSIKRLNEMSKVSLFNLYRPKE